MNKVILIGNLTKDPELRYPNGDNQIAFCRFTVAVNDGYGDKEKTSFIPIITFGNTAENCERFLTKGNRVAVEGRIQTGNYTNKDGHTVYTTDVISDKVEFLTGASKGTSVKPDKIGKKEIFNHENGLTPLSEDDIPF